MGTLKFCLTLLAGIYLGGAIRGLCSAAVFWFADALDAMKWADVYLWPKMDLQDLWRWSQRRRRGKGAINA